MNQINQNHSIKTFADSLPIIIQTGREVTKMFDEVDRFHLNNPELRSVYEDVYNYFVGIGNKYSSKKGLMIVGSVGTGKTIMMKVFSKLIYDHEGSPMMDMIDANTIIRDFLINGFDVIEKYSSRHYFSKNHKPRGLCIDDLGMENQKVKNFGNEADVISEILFSRYNQMIDRGMKTFATSNISPEKLGALYGDRIADRMIQMFNVITLTGKSLRK